MAGVLRASATCSRNFFATFSPQSLPSGASSASRASSELEVADDLGVRRHEGVEARDRGEREHRALVGPGLRLQLHRIEPHRDDEIGFVHQLALDQAADDAAGAQRMVFRDRALALGRGEDRRAELLGELHELRRRLAPVDAEADQQDRPPRPLEHVERRLEVGAVRTGKHEVRHQRRLGQVVAGLPRGLALRQLEMDRAGRRPRRGAHGAAHLLAHHLGVDGGAPLHDRLVDGELVEALAQADLVGRPRIGIGDGDQRRTVEIGVGDAVDHVGGAGAAGRHADAGAAGDVAPGRGQHGARHLLLHQQEPHLALARRLHQLDRLAAGMSDDEGRARLLECGRQHFDARGHSPGLSGFRLRRQRSTVGRTATGKRGT